MTRDEVLQRLRDSRAEFEEALRAIPPERLDEPVPGGSHTPKEIVGHVTSYDWLVVERLRKSRVGETTDFDRDRVGWEAFNERIWAEASELATEDALQRSWAVFGEMLEAIEKLTDEELERPTGATEKLDPAWLEDRAPWELIGIDTFDHYPMHVEHLRSAAR